VLKGFDKKFCRTLNLEEASAIVSSAGNEESSGARCSAGDRHTAIVTARTSEPKEAAEKVVMLKGTASAVPQLSYFVLRL
jgi:hypothetical protein